MAHLDVAPTTANLTLPLPCSPLYEKAVWKPQNLVQNSASPFLTDMSGVVMNMKKPTPASRGSFLLLIISSMIAAAWQ
jgi:hypothetical protein